MLWVLKRTLSMRGLKGSSDGKENIHNFTLKKLCLSRPMSCYFFHCFFHQVGGQGATNSLFTIMWLTEVVYLPADNSYKISNLICLFLQVVKFVWIMLSAASYGQESWTPYRRVTFFTRQ